MMQERDDSLSGNKKFVALQEVLSCHLSLALSESRESSPVQEGRAGEPETGSFCNVVNRRKS